MSWKNVIFGNPHTKPLKSLQPLVERINALESEVKALSDEDLRAKTDVFRAELASGKTLEDIIVPASAVVREVARRTTGMRHFDVQVLGALALHYGNIAEMKTGEGKTLVATIPLYLNALAQPGAHLVTVNDYLAKRDAVLMGQIYDFLGLSVGVITNQETFIYDANAKADDEERDEIGAYKVAYDYLRPATRSEAYACDIVYGTNNEFGFDYLRDNIEYHPDKLRQKKLSFAIIDEVDSVLIDEARTPLIISAPAEDAEQLYTTFARVARTLEEGPDYTVDEKFRAIELTDAGISKAENQLGLDNIYTDKGVKYVHHLENAVRAKALYVNDKDYVVRDDEVVIVDPFTGRMQPGRRWSEGLHQAVEAKEGVTLKKESRTFASITFQNYFRLYDKIAGMTGTALTSAEEFLKVYGMNVLEIPTHRPIARIDSNDLIFQTEHGKLLALSREVKRRQEAGQPVLIGTVSIEKNELVTKYLDTAGVTYDVLNAKNHEREGSIIAQAGRKGAVTVATNMAGRGVDIKLGGNPAPEGAYEKIKDLGGLVVYGTERHEARRIDNQLRGRSGRQGDPGETQFFVSMEDHLMRVFASEMMSKMMGRFGIPEDEPIENKLITRSLEGAQRKIEGFHFDSRKRILDYDNVLNQQRKSIYTRRRDILTGGVEALSAYLSELTTMHPDEADAIGNVQDKLQDETFASAVRNAVLQTTDMLWMEHLEAMDHARSSVNLRAYGQRDPLIEYKKEGLQLFRNLESRIDENVLKLLPHVNPDMKIDAPQQTRAVHPDAQSASAAVASSITKQAQIAQRAGDRNVGPQQPIVKGDGEDIGRNEQVTIRKGDETKTLKYKKAQALLNEGWELER